MQRNGERKIRKGRTGRDQKGGEGGQRREIKDNKAKKKKRQDTGKKQQWRVREKMRGNGRDQEVQKEKKTG